MKRSKHEIALERALAMYGHDLPPYLPECPVIPGRLWRWDFAWPTQQVLVEVQGGTFARGRSAHTGASLQTDFEKNNAAVVAGWSVLYFTARDMTARTLPATVDIIRQAIRRHEP